MNFILVGRKINDRDTPKKIEMDVGNVIDVIVNRYADSLNTIQKHIKQSLMKLSVHNDFKNKYLSFSRNQRILKTYSSLFRQKKCRIKGQIYHHMFQTE